MCDIERFNGGWEDRFNVCILHLKQKRKVFSMLSRCIFVL